LIMTRPTLRLVLARLVGNQSFVLGSQARARRLFVVAYLGSVAHGVKLGTAMNLPQEKL
jgi:hypothetical protein